MNLLIEGIKKNIAIKTGRATKLTVDGITDTYPIYQVKLDYLFFNDQNDRIATWISQYKTDKGIEKISMDNIEEYNALIQSFITKSNPDKMKQTEKNIQLFGQQKDGVVLNDGRIIDGNRRFCCLRNLAKKDPKFGYFETVILDRDYQHSAKAIKMLELQIQIGEEARVDYDPIDRLVGIYRDLVRDKLLTVSEYARSANMKEKEVQKHIEYANLLVEFLEAINAPEQFYIARENDLNGPLVELHGVLNKINDEEKKQAIKYAVFTNFLLAPSGDMTRFVRDFKNIASSKYLDDFIEEQSELSEDVLDSLPEVGKVNASTISQIRKDREDARTKTSKQVERYSEKAKISDAKEKPRQLLDKAIDKIYEIDFDVVARLPKKKREEISEAISVLEDAINELKEVL